MLRKQPEINTDSNSITDERNPIKGGFLSLLTKTWRCIHFHASLENNQDELGKSKHSVGKDQFFTKTFSKIDNFAVFWLWWDIAKIVKIQVKSWFLCLKCAFSVPFGFAYGGFARGSYSPRHGDNPRYPYLAKIPKITCCSSPQRWKIFFFE